MKVWKKELVFNKYTRWIDRDYNIKLTQGLIIKMPEDWVAQTEFEWKQMENMQVANDILVNKMTWLSFDEIDDLSLEDYNLIITEITKIKENKTPTIA